MQHLLLNRFQGALIGGNIIYLTAQQIAPNQLEIDTAPILKAGIASSIRCRGFDEQDWLANTSSATNHPDRAIVAMLPLILFFHDDRAKLREVILNVSRSWQLDWETCSCAVAIGCIIARSLSESFSPTAIIPQVLDEMTNLHPLLFQQLSTLDRLLEQPSSLAQTTQKFLTTEHPTISKTIMAIYCFLSTPEDFSLAILRARQVEDKSQLICTLTGIFAGAHNSSTSIPLNGLLATQEREQWLTAAENLLSLWAGVYDVSTQPIGLLPPGSQPAVAYALPVAAPKVMQRRD
jgi:ADP-ribosylglycohydrolase